MKLADRIRASKQARKAEKNRKMVIKAESIHDFTEADKFDLWQCGQCGGEVSVTKTYGHNEDHSKHWVELHCLSGHLVTRIFTNPDGSLNEFDMSVYRK